MAKANVKIWQLLDLIDYNRESTIEKLQICRPSGDWDEYDEVSTGSALLIPLYEAEVEEIEAIDKEIIRVGIDWDKLDVFNWGKKENQ